MWKIPAGQNYKIRLDYGAFPDRPYDSPGTWGDPAKINRILAMDKRNSNETIRHLFFYEKTAMWMISSPTISQICIRT